jgi:putative Holliday junction resolvase
MKIAALDLGDQWIGIALSDLLAMTGRPLKTITAAELQTTVKDLLAREPISAIVVGLPITLRGTQSEQTHKIRSQFEQLAKQFPTVSWHLWDERLTSQQAAALKKGHSKEEKLKQHAIAAAFILQSYLDHLAYKKAILDTQS